MNGAEIGQILEMLIPIAGIVFGTLLVGYVFGKITGLIKAWINRKNSSYDEEAFDRLAKAFIKHKKETDRRLQNLEALLTNEDRKSLSSSKRQLNKSRSSQTIEIDSDHSDSGKESGETDRGGNLKNMLDKSGAAS